MSGQFACRRSLGYAALRARNLIERAAAQALSLRLRSAPRNPARSFHCESLEPRNLFSGSISGTLWQDTNASQTRDAGEPALANWVVYLDANRNRIRDAAEAFTTTSAAGTYTFSNLDAGTYFIGEEIPLSWQQTTPGPNGQQHPAPPPSAPVALTATPTFHSSSTGSATTGITALTTTDSAVKVHIDSTPVAPSDAESSSLIHLNQYASDARFQGADGRGSSIVIIDTGIDNANPEFGPDVNHDGIADRIVYQYDFADSDADATDHNGHGTNVASIAAGAIYGMAPRASIIALKVFTDAGSGTFGEVEAALQWVVAHAAEYNIVSVNMSLGDSANYSTEQFLYGIDDEMATLAASDVMVVSAAGNGFNHFGSQQGVAYPAADPNSLAVSAVWDSSGGFTSWSDGSIDYSYGPDRITSFSQRSTALTDIFAPGAFITGAGLNGGTSTYAGTSQATPHVAGIVALAQQVAMTQLGRRLTFSEFRNLLRTTGASIFDGDDENDNVVNTSQTYFRLDAFALANAIYNLGSALPFGHTIVLATDEDVTDIDFGNDELPLETGAPVLAASSDTGISSSDLLTNHDNSNGIKKLTFTVPGTLAGATLTIYANGAAIGTVLATADFTTITTSGSLKIPEGLASITARQSVPDRPESADSPELDITIDTLAPSMPTLFDLDAASDSGLSNTDNITNDNTPTFTLSAGQYWKVTRGVFTIGAAYSTGTSFTSPLTPDGPFTYNLFALDAAGNQSAAKSLAVTIDTIAYQASSPYDTTFGSAGSAFYQQGFGGQPRDIARQSDGKYIVVGYSGESPAFHSSLRIQRLNPNGSLDTTFATAGWFNYFARYGNELHAVAIQPDGKIVAAGFAGDGSESGVSPRFCLIRLNPDGSLDPTFGAGGVVISNVGSGACEINDLALLPDGSILVAGEAYGPSGTRDFTLARYTASGALDSTFGAGGIAFANPTGLHETAQAMAIAADGKIVLTGYAGSSLLTARFTPAGALDTTFNATGFRTDNIGLVSTFGYDVVVQPDLKIVIAGYKEDASSTDAQDQLLVRYNAGGSLDTTFDSDGIVIQNFSPAAFERAESLVLESDGKLVTVGIGNNAMLVARYEPTGALDTTFATAGLLTYQPMPGEAYGYAALYQPEDGMIVASGYSWPGFGFGDFNTIRIQANLSIPAPTLAAASDTGVSSSDHITSDNTPTFDFTLPANHYFRFFEGGVQISGDYTAGSTYTTPSQADGAHTFSLMIADTAGNLTAMSQVTAISIDTAGPTLTLDTLSPTRADALSTINFSFDETVYNFSGSSQLSLTRDDNSVFDGSQILSSPSLSHWTLSNLASLTSRVGSYQFNINLAGITDAAGNSIAGSALRAWVQNTLEGDSSDDMFHLVRNAANAALTDVIHDGQPAYSVDLAALGQLQVHGNLGDDVLTLDLAEGALTAPAGIFYDGDALVISGSSADDSAIFTGASATAGAVNIALANVSHFAFAGAAGNDTLTISDASPTFTSDLAAATANLTLVVENGASVTFTATQNLADLRIDASSSVALAPGGSSVLLTRGLSIDPTAKLDLNDHDLLLDYSAAAASPFTTAANWVITGFAGAPNPAKTGIVSSTSQANSGRNILALFDNALVGATEWKGHAIAPNSVIGAYTLFGDVNLDGIVTGDDYTIIDSNLNTTPAPGMEWLSGDANLDGIVTGDDYTVIDSNLGLTASAPLSASSLHLTSATDDLLADSANPLA